MVLALCLHVYCFQLSIFILCEDFLCNSVLKNADYAVFAKLSIQCGTCTTKFSKVKPTFEKENSGGVSWKTTLGYGGLKSSLNSVDFC